MMRNLSFKDWMLLGIVSGVWSISGIESIYWGVRTVKEVIILYYHSIEMSGVSITALIIKLHVDATIEGVFLFLFILLSGWGVKIWLDLGKTH